MKFLVALAVLVAVAAAAPTDKEAQIVSRVYDNIGTGPFIYGFESSNGIQVSSEGELVNLGPGQDAVVIRGSYAYTGPDGVLYTLTYTADQNGFHPEGAHLPKSP